MQRWFWGEVLVVFELYAIVLNRFYVFSYQFVILLLNLDLYHEQ